MKRNAFRVVKKRFIMQKNSRSIVCVVIVTAFLCGLSCAFLHTSLHNFSHNYSHTYSQANSVSSNFSYKNRIKNPIKNRIKKPILPQKNTAVRTSWIKSDSIASYVMSEIRNARSRLYDDRSMYFEGVPLQDYVRRFGLTKQAYVNNIQYDSENEEDAYRRAQETAQHGKLGHFAPDGVSDPNYSGRKAWGENLSWGLDFYGSMKGWIGDEEAPLRSARGYFTEEDSHLYQILNPSNLSFAYGEAPGGPYGIVGVMTLSEYHGNIDYSVGKIGYSGPSEEEKRRAAEEEAARKKKEEEERKAREEEEEKLRLARKAHKAHKKHHKVVKALKKISAFNWALAATIAAVAIVVIAAVACGIWYFLLRKKKRAELESSEDIAKELSEEKSEEKSEDTSEKLSEENTEEKSAEKSEENTEETSEKSTEDSAESESSEDSTEEKSEENTEETFRR